jgi:hypothetical protein
MTHQSVPSGHGFFAHCYACMEPHWSVNLITDDPGYSCYFVCDRCASKNYLPLSHQIGSVSPQLLNRAPEITSDIAVCLAEVDAEALAAIAVKVDPMRNVGMEDIDIVMALREEFSNLTFGFWTAFLRLIG